MVRYAALIAVALVGLITIPSVARSQESKPNIVIIWGDDIGQSDVSAYVGNWLQSFKELPDSFNLDRVMEAVTAGSKNQ